MTSVEEAAVKRSPSLPWPGVAAAALCRHPASARVFGAAIMAFRVRAVFADFSPLRPGEHQCRALAGGPDAAHPLGADFMGGTFTAGSSMGRASRSGRARRRARLRVGVALGLVSGFLAAGSTRGATPGRRHAGPAVLVLGSSWRRARPSLGNTIVASRFRSSPIRRASSAPTPCIREMPRRAARAVA